MSPILIDGFPVVNFLVLGQNMSVSLTYPLFKIDGFLGTQEPMPTRPLSEKRGAMGLSPAVGRVDG